MSNPLRITGLASGLDVDAIVKQLMQAQSVKLDKVKQDKQILEWKQEAYRDIIGGINTFKSTYFDVLKSDTYMLSDRNYSSYDTKTSNDGATFTAIAYGNAVSGTYNVTVSRLAEKARITGVNSEINIESSISDIKFPAQISSSLANNVISIDIGTGAKDITIEDGNYYLPDLISNINQKISASTDLNNKVKAALSSDGKSIRFVGMMEITDANKNLTFNVDGTDHIVTLGKGNYTFDEIASQINNKLKTEGIDSKIVAGVSADGKNVTFTHNTGDSSTISVGGTSVSAGSTQNSLTYFTNTLAISNSNYNAANQVLEYDRKIIEGVNDTLSIVVNGVNYNVKLAAESYGKPSSATTDLQIRNGIVSNLHNALTTANGNTVNLTTLEGLDARLSLDQSKIEFVSKSNKTVTISGNANSTLGFNSSFDINQSTTDKMSTLFGGSLSGMVSFTINDGTKNVDFNYDFNSSTNITSGTAPNEVTVIGAKNKTIADIISDISSKTNTKLSYSELTRTFSLESSATGQAQSISVTTKTAGDTTTDNFLSTLFGSVRNDSGVDAEVTIVSPNSTDPGITVVKSTNNFTIDGVNYNLIKPDPGNPQTLTVTSNAQKSFDKIKSLIDKYNELIDKINSKTSEKKQYDYKPLTDAQKDDMSDDEIAKWETKAKEGLLSNDSTLENMLYSIRRAFSDPVKENYDDPSGSSIGISLSEIGLSTSSDISLRGKIIIDETKLKDAIQNNGDKISKLFTKSSTTVSSYSPDLTDTQKTQRYNESGIFQRINDILLGNVRTTRNIDGKKGILLEKAGIKGDYSEFNNMLSDELDDKDKLISNLTAKLADKEQAYYLQYSKLETAMQKLNDQSSWLSQMLGSSK